MTDVTAFGEFLIDFTPAGLSEQGSMLFERNPGGAPANVAVCVSRLGGRPAFIGKVGNDMFGDFLAETLEKYNVNVSGLRFSDRWKTTLAFVQLDKNGDRSFSFYRDPGADTTIEDREVDCRLIEDSKVFHFGSLSLTDEPARTATEFALDKAKKIGCVISYDPNLRPSLWSSMDDAEKRMLSVMEHVDVLKVSEEELEFLTGEIEPEWGTAVLSEKYRIGTILVTMGHKGCFYRCGKDFSRADTFKSYKAVDTTGAGDAFMGGFLFYMLNMAGGETCWHKVSKTGEAAVFANAVASLCVTRKGAIPAMPSLDEVKSVLEREKQA